MGILQCVIRAQFRTLRLQLDRPAVVLQPRRSVAEEFPDVGERRMRSGVGRIRLDRELEPRLRLGVPAHHPPPNPSQIPRGGVSPPPRPTPRALPRTLRRGAWLRSASRSRPLRSALPCLRRAAVGAPARAADPAPPRASPSD